MQKKPTMYPEWKSSFDAHIYEGRVIQIVLMRAAEEPVSEVTVGVSVLAERCKKNNGKAEFWVRGTATVTHVCGQSERVRPRAPGRSGHWGSSVANSLCSNPGPAIHQTLRLSESASESVKGETTKRPMVGSVLMK